MGNDPTLNANWLLEIMMREEKCGACEGVGAELFGKESSEIDDVSK